MTTRDKLIKLDGVLQECIDRNVKVPGEYIALVKKYKCNDYPNLIRIITMEDVRSLNHIYKQCRQVLKYIKVASASFQIVSSNPKI